MVKSGLKGAKAAPGSKNKAGKQTVKTRQPSVNGLLSQMKTEINKPSKRARQVTIPAGKLYITFSPGDTVYIPGQEHLPATLPEYARQLQAKAYEQGKADKYQEIMTSEMNTRQPTPEEFLQKILQGLRGYHANDQNQILAVLLDETSKDRERRLKELRAQLDNTQELIGLCEESQNGLQLVREGGFEKLKFR